MKKFDLTAIHKRGFKMTYFKQEDILHLIVSGDKETDSIELSPNITAEINDKGELIGIEILEASSFIRDFILESSQAKFLELNKIYNNKMHM
jgi:uncharacterized protein YuzE